MERECKGIEAGGAVAATYTAGKLRRSVRFWFPFTSTATLAVLGALCGEGRSTEARRRGAAYIIALIVLTALFLLAVPFAVLMRFQHSAGTQALHTARARSGESGALSHARAVLYKGLQTVEADVPVFPFDNPDVDSLWEFHVALRTRVSDPDNNPSTQTNVIPASGAVAFFADDGLGVPNDGNSNTTDGYIRVDDEWMAYYHVDVDTENMTVGFPGGTVTVPAEGRGLFGTQEAEHAEAAIVSFFPGYELWQLDVEDQQARINVNTAPFQVILNLLGYLRIGGNSPDDLPTGDPLLDFPTGRQMNLAAAISAYRLYYSYWENDDNRDGLQTPEENNVADGTYTRFENLNMVKNTNIAPWFDAGMPPLSAAEFDRVHPYLTVHSEPPGGAPWILVGGLTVGLNDGTPGETQYWAAMLDNASRVPVGSVVALYESATGDTAYRMVTSVSRTINLLEDLPAGAIGLVKVDNSTGILDDSRQVQMTDEFGAGRYTPGYLYVDNEWVEYSYVSPADSEIYVSDRGLWGTSDALHSAGTPMDGGVVGWRYDDGGPGTSDGLTGSLTPPVQAEDFPGGAGLTEVRIENRHAININTVTEPTTLKTLLNGLSDGTVTISPDEAIDIAERLLSHTSAGLGPSDLPLGPPYDFFNGDEAWFSNRAGLNGFIDGLPPGPAGRQLLKDNFDPNQSPNPWPSVSTVPLRFNSGTLIGIDPLGIADDRALTPVAQSPRSAGLELARVYDVVPPLEGIWWALRSQQEFYDYMAATGQRVVDGGHIFTTSLKEDLPPAMLAGKADYDDPSHGIGTVAPAVDMLNPYYMTDADTPVYATAVMGLHESPPSLNLNYSIAGDTALAVSMPASAANTTAEGITNVRLQYWTRYGDVAGWRHIEADSFHATMQPFAVEFWIRPGQDVTTRQLLVDIGKSDPDAVDASNQVRLYLQGGRIVLRMDEPIDDNKAGYAGFVEATSSSTGFPFEAGEWHHVAVAAVGPFRNEIAMLIDGIYDRQMEWQYDYRDSSGGQHTASDATVREGSFLPIAMAFPNRGTTVTRGPIGDQWVPGMTEIGLADISWLPQRGWVVINTSDRAYEYDGFSTETLPDSTVVATITLVNPLEETHAEGEAVALMIPVARTAAHKESYVVPADTDLITLHSHSEVIAGNGSYQIDPGSPVYQMGSERSSAAFPGYMWLGIDPALFPLDPPGAGVDLEPAGRWKVLVHHQGYLDNSRGVLAGSLPTGPLGDAFSVGGDRNGTALFQGELDELRISALPMALVGAGGWAQGNAQAVVQEWGWYPDPALNNWWRIGLVNPAALDMRSNDPLHATGGHFLVEGRLYSYQTYDAGSGLLDGIAQVSDDLTPSGLSGLAVNHNALHRIIPLNFITTSRMAAAGYLASDVDIPVVDARQFPQEGYVQVDQEIVAYSGKDLVNNLLLRPVNAAGLSALPRGAYGTAASDHAADAIVRHLPVRHLDRYRAETAPGPWDVHTTYTDVQLNSQMCMLSYSVSHAGQLSSVWWRFKRPLEDGQKVAVLVLIDGGSGDPDGDGKTWSETPGSGDEPLLWGTVYEGANLEDSLWFDPHPTVATKVEVRFYFDLGSTHPYNTTYAAGAPVPDGGWSNMVELDAVGIQMTPVQLTF